MTRIHGWRRLSAAWLLAYALALAAGGCQPAPCERPSLEIAGDADEPLRKSARLTVQPTVRHLESHIRVGCTAQGYGEPGVRVSVCALGRCTHAAGPQAYLDLWPRDWDRLPDLDTVHCIVIRKEQQVFDGPWFNPQLVETLPERTLLAARIPVTTGCQKAPAGPRYCADGRWQDDRWVCERWVR